MPGGEAELAFILANWACVNDRPVWERNELVLPAEDGRSKCELGPVRFGGGVQRRREVDGDVDTVNGWMDWVDSRREAMVVPLGRAGVGDGVPCHVA